MKNECEDEDKLRQKFFKEMLTIRVVEEKILELFSKGLVSGTTHTCIGQEACAVGVVNALDCDKDIIFSNHRGHGHFLVYCGDIEGLFTEIMGREAGVCGGNGGSQHLCEKNFYSSGIQGGMVPSAIGVAFAEKEKQTGAIVTVFIGDGTLGQGVVYESLNIAALWSLPILFVVEDNKYAQSTPSKLQHAGKLSERALPFQIESKELEVKDPIEVYDITCKIVKKVRENIKPYFLVLHTYRLGPHSKGDDFRPKEEINKYKKRDPLLNLENQLYQSFTKETKEFIKKKVNSALEKAQKSSLKDFAQFSKEVGFASNVFSKSK